METRATVYKLTGMSRHPVYGIWKTMKRRCYNQNDAHYAEYGGRGIVVCDEWKNDFLAFYRDMGERPSSKHSIERINNDLGYCKSNCKWATKEEQQSNRRNNILIEYNNQIVTCAQLSRILGYKNQGHLAYMIRRKGAKQVIEQLEKKEGSLENNPVIILPPNFDKAILGDGQTTKFEPFVNQSKCQ